MVALLLGLLLPIWAMAALPSYPLGFCNNRPWDTVMQENTGHTPCKTIRPEQCLNYNIGTPYRVQHTCQNECSLCPYNPGDCQDSKKRFILVSGSARFCANLHEVECPKQVDDGTFVWYHCPATCHSITQCTIQTSPARFSLPPSVSPSVDYTSQSPSETPSLLPSAWPSLLPSENPTISSSLEPSLSPSDNPIEFRSESPSLFPSDNPTMSSSLAPTVFASETPWDSPSASPTLLVSNNPTKFRSESPSLLVSGIPTELNSSTPTLLASATPFDSPSASPSLHTSNNPTKFRSESPSLLVSDSPTELSSLAPTLLASVTPTESFSDVPSVFPSESVTDLPTKTAWKAPSESPSGAASESPTRVPIVSLTESPTSVRVPTSSPTKASVTLTKSPTNSPSRDSTKVPTPVPITQSPTVSPSDTPTKDPTVMLSESPTTSALIGQTNNGGEEPTEVPTSVLTTKQPIEFPSQSPSVVLVVNPNEEVIPTETPTVVPTSAPTMVPSTESPTVPPTMVPSTESPTVPPTKAPSMSILLPTSLPTKELPVTERPIGSPAEPPNGPTESPSGNVSSKVPTEVPSDSSPETLVSQLPTVVATTKVPTRRPDKPTVSATESPSLSLTAPSSEYPKPLPNGQPFTSTTRQPQLFTDAPSNQMPSVPSLALKPGSETATERPEATATPIMEQTERPISATNPAAAAPPVTESSVGDDDMVDESNVEKIPSLSPNFDFRTGAPSTFGTDLQPEISPVSEDGKGQQESSAFTEPTNEESVKDGDANSIELVEETGNETSVASELIDVTLIKTAYLEGVDGISIQVATQVTEIMESFFLAYYLPDEDIVCPYARRRLERRRQGRYMESTISFISQTVHYDDEDQEPTNHLMYVHHMVYESRQESEIAFNESSKESFQREMATPDQVARRPFMDDLEEECLTCIRHLLPTLESFSVSVNRPPQAKKLQTDDSDSSTWWTAMYTSLILLLSGLIAVWLCLCLRWVWMDDSDTDTILQFRESSREEK